MSRASGGRTVRTVRIGSFTANAVEDGADVSIGDVQTRVSNCVSASPCLDADGSFAGKSTSRKRPIVSGRFRLFQNVSEPSDAAASGWSKRPRGKRSSRVR